MVSPITSSPSPKQKTQHPNPSKKEESDEKVDRLIKQVLSQPIPESNPSSKERKTARKSVEEFLTRDPFSEKDLETFYKILETNGLCTKMTFYPLLGMELNRILKECEEKRLLLGSEQIEIRSEWASIFFGFYLHLSIESDPQLKNGEISSIPKKGDLIARTKTLRKLINNYINTQKKEKNTQNKLQIDLYTKKLNFFFDLFSKLLSFENSSLILASYCLSNFKNGDRINPSKPSDLWEGWDKWKEHFHFIALCFQEEGFVPLLPFLRKVQIALQTLSRLQNQVKEEHIDALLKTICALCDESQKIYSIASLSLQNPRNERGKEKGLTQPVDIRRDETIEQPSFSSLILFQQSSLILVSFLIGIFDWVKKGKRVLNPERIAEDAYLGRIEKALYALIHVSPDLSFQEGLDILMLHFTQKIGKLHVEMSNFCKAISASDQKIGRESLKEQIEIFAPLLQEALSFFADGLKNIPSGNLPSPARIAKKTELASIISILLYDMERVLNKKPTYPNIWPDPFREILKEEEEGIQFNEGGWIQDKKEEEIEEGLSSPPPVPQSISEDPPGLNLVEISDQPPPGRSTPKKPAAPIPPLAPLSPQMTSEEIIKRLDFGTRPVKTRKVISEMTQILKERGIPLTMQEALQVTGGRHPIKVMMPDGRNFPFQTNKSEIPYSTWKKISKEFADRVVVGDKKEP